MFEIAEKVFAILLLIVTMPLLIAAYIGGWVWGSTKYAFKVGYGTSIAGAEDKAKADQLERAINTVLAQARQEGREEGSKLQ